MTDDFPESSLWRTVLYAFVTALIVAGAFYSGYLFFSTTRALAARTSLPFVDNVSRSKPMPGRAPQHELPDLVEKRERINVLLLGIDQRENEQGPWRTDTMILVSIDPSTKSTSMLSIPRDLWVTIPGFGENRVNVAHYLGDLRGYPGGGVALAKKTVWHALGVPVHYYVRVNFGGFERIIDAVGGLTIDVKEPIHDESYPDGNYGTIVVDISAGIQHMDGVTALQYARSRHGKSDFDRMARQQAVILAARDKVLSLDIPLVRIPKLVELAGDSIQTDMNIDEILALAEVAKTLDRSRIQHGIIEDSMTTTVTTPEGSMVEVADWEKVRRVVDHLFPVTLAAAQPTPSLAKAQLAAEGARIELQNGTLVADLAWRTAELLREKGFNIVDATNADRFDRAQTLIVDYGNNHYSVEALALLLNVAPENVRREPGGQSDVDVRVILGRDYAQRVGQQ